MKQARAGWSAWTWVIILCAATFGGAFWYAASRPWSGTVAYTPAECLAAGGRVMDTFNREAVFAAGEYLGDIKGLKCPCVCLTREGISNE